MNVQTANVKILTCEMGQDLCMQVPETCDRAYAGRKEILVTALSAVNKLAQGSQKPSRVKHTHAHAYRMRKQRQPKRWLEKINSRTVALKVSLVILTCTPMCVFVYTQ